MKRAILMVFFACILYNTHAQNIVTGIIVDSETENPIENVKIRFLKTVYLVKTSTDGAFIIACDTDGNYILEITNKGYETEKFPISFAGRPINLGTLFMFKNKTKQINLSVLSLTEDELHTDTGASDNISGLLQASKDVYLRAAAYEFSASFFRVKGLGSENGSLLINGVELNKIFTGRPQWSNWGGLNDLTNYQEFNAGITASVYSFGRTLGVTNINIRPTTTRPGNKISYAASNRSYNHRIMATHNSGVLKNNWAFSFSGSRRSALEGYSDGTFYDAYSFLASIEKKLNHKNSIQLSAIVAPNKRGKSSANTQEAFDLKGRRYNSYWGIQNGNIRNARVKEITEPILLLNHYYKINSKSTLTTSIGYQFGKVSNSRIDYNGSKIDNFIAGIPSIVKLGGTNPDPSYYQKMPSYALKKNDPYVYEIMESFVTDGQLDWEAMYRANQHSFNNGHATYILYEDRNDDKFLNLQSNYETEITTHMLLNASIQLKQFTSHNYAKLTDVLGGHGFLDIDPYAENNERKQNDILHPNRIVYQGDHFKYNYNLEARIAKGFAQVQFNYPKFDAFIASSISHTSYQRIGKYKNGKYKKDHESFGSSQQLLFTNFGLKTGGTFKITGRHFIDLNLAHTTEAPLLKNSFSNMRISNAVVENLDSEYRIHGNLSYMYRSPRVQGKISTYLIKNRNATEVSFYYADGIGGNDQENTAFVQEVITDLDSNHLGIEMGIEVALTPALKFKGAANIGQYTFNNNPNLSLSSESRDFQFTSRVAHLKNYKLPAGPQQAYSLGFEYRASDYWWIGATVNFLGATYADINPLTRTFNLSDDGGIPFHDYDPNIAKQLLQQEQFKNYSLVNLVGGKTWKIQTYYIGFFASIGNVFNTRYKTGGFEQGRNANFRELIADESLNKPIFGNKYWYGRGTTYFLNLSIRN